MALRGTTAVAVAALLALSAAQGCAAAPHIVFTCPQAHSIADQMLGTAQELIRRGYKVTLWGNTRFQALAEDAGMDFVAMPVHWPVGHLKSNIDSMVASAALRDQPFSWTNHSKDMAELIGTIGLLNYKEFVEGWDAAFRTNPPDLVVVDLFSGAIMDLATSRNLPWVLFHTFFQGSLASLQDCWACPDAVHGQSASVHLNSFTARLIKMIGKVHFIAHLLPHVPALDKLRKEVTGLAPYGPPVSQFIKHHTISTWPDLFDVPRMVSPLFHQVGFMAQRFDASLPREQWRDDERTWWDWLDRAHNATSNGVIYISFGSELFMVPERLSKIIKGASDSAVDHDMQVLLALRQDAQEALPQELLQSLPPRVTLAEWVPQAAILAHPAVKVFITHAGQASIVQAVYGRVPMLLVPGFADQFANSYRAAERHLGLQLDPSRFTPGDVASKLWRLRHEPQFQQALDKWEAYSRVGTPPAQRAADIIEQELLFRTSELLVPVEQTAPAYVAYGLDVMAVVLLVPAVLAYVVVRGLVAALRALTGKRGRGGKVKQQ